MTSAATACRHHWEIETTNLEIARGTCKSCQETRDFQNHAPWIFNNVDLDARLHQDIAQELAGRL